MRLASWSCPHSSIARESIDPLIPRRGLKDILTATTRKPCQLHDEVATGFACAWSWVHRVLKPGKKYDSGLVETFRSPVGVCLGKSLYHLRKWQTFCELVSPSGYCRAERVESPHGVSRASPTL